MRGADVGAADAEQLTAAVTCVLVASIVLALAILMRNRTGELYEETSTYPGLPRLLYGGNSLCADRADNPEWQQHTRDDRQSIAIKHRHGRHRALCDGAGNFVDDSGPCSYYHVPGDPGDYDASQHIDDYDEFVVSR